MEIDFEKCIGKFRRDLIGSVIACRPAVSATGESRKKSEFSKNNIFYLPIHFKYIDILDANTSEMSRDPNKNVINCLELKKQDQSCVAL